MDVKGITSPPKGRSRKNVHNLSYSDSDSPDKKKMRKDSKKESSGKDTSLDKKDSDALDEENLKKVADFVKKLEAKKVKYSQSRINFQPTKSNKSS